MGRVHLTGHWICRHNFWTNYDRNRRDIRRPIGCKSAVDMDMGDLDDKDKADMDNMDDVDWNDLDRWEVCLDDFSLLVLGDRQTMAETHELAVVDGFLPMAERCTA